MRKIKSVKIDDISYIYINRGINNFLFTHEELSIAKRRFEKWKKQYKE